jgi:hypothetical protein
MSYNLEDLPQRPEPIADRPSGHSLREAISESLKEDYRRPRQEQLRDYEIRIRFLSVGMVIQVGCKEIPFSSVEHGMEELNAYVKNPHEEIKRWNTILDQ